MRCSLFVTALFSLIIIILPCLLSPHPLGSCLSSITNLDLHKHTRSSSPTQISSPHSLFTAKYQTEYEARRQTLALQTQTQTEYTVTRASASPIAAVAFGNPTPQDLVQYTALMGFYNSTSGIGWTNNTGWGQTSASAICSSWYGITCNSQNQIIWIVLTANNLVGTLDNSLSTLINLQHLDLSVNLGITGTVPPSWSSLTNMSYINFREASLSGPLPVVVCAMTQLTYLDFSSNQLNGTLPNCISNLVQLTQLSVPDNQLTGTIPTSYTSLKALGLLDISHNSFTGDFSSVAIQLPVITAIFAHNNNFQGTLPISLLDLPSLFMLDLSYNNYATLNCTNYNVNNYTGRQSPVQVLILAANGLNAPLASVIDCLAILAPNASWIDLSYNNIVWSNEPLSWQNWYFPFIYKLDLSSNQLYGDVASFLETFFWLGQLYYFDFNNNYLYGTATDIAGQFLEIGAAGNTKMTAALNYSSNPLTVITPDWITLDQSTQLQQVGLNMQCPKIAPSRSSNLLQLTIDPVYLLYQHCTCLQGFALSASANVTNVTSITCVTCPEHVDCSNAVYNPHHSTATGYYPFPLLPSSYNENPRTLIDAQLIACNPPSVCSASGSDTSAIENSFQCASGHDIDSFLCSKCESQYFNWQGYCNSCGDNSSVQWLLPFFIIIGGGIIFGFLLFYFIREERGRYNRRVLGDGLDEAMASNPDNELSKGVDQNDLDLFSMATLTIDSQHWAFVDIILFWWQASSVLQGLNYGDGTGSDSSTLGSLSFIGLLLRFSPFAMECLFPNIDFRAYFWVFMLSPIWLCLLLLLFYYVIIGARRIMIAHGYFDQYLPNWVFVRAAVRLSALLLSLVYMQVAIYCFQVWVCDTVASPQDTYHYLYAAPYIQCYTGSHNTQIAFSALMFLGFVLAYPILTIYWMVYFKPRPIEDDIREAKVLVTIEQLFTEDARNKLRAGLSQWQGVVIIRKLIITALVYLIPAGSSAIPVSVVLLLFILVAVQAWYKPYYRWSDNILESILLVHLALEFLVSILLGEASVADQSLSYNSLSNFLAALNWIGYGFVGLVLLLHVALYFIKSDTELLDKYCCCMSCLWIPHRWRNWGWKMLNLMNYTQEGEILLAAEKLNDSRKQQQLLQQQQLAKLEKEKVFGTVMILSGTDNGVNDVFKPSTSASVSPETALPTQSSSTAANGVTNPSTAVVAEDPTAVGKRPEYVEYKSPASSHQHEGDAQHFDVKEIEFARTHRLPPVPTSASANTTVQQIPQTQQQSQPQPQPRDASPASDTTASLYPVYTAPTDSDPASSPSFVLGPEMEEEI